MYTQTRNFEPMKQPQVLYTLMACFSFLGWRYGLLTE